MNTQIPPERFLYQIDDIFTPKECKCLIEKAENIGWHTMDRGIALYDRALMTDQNLADYIFQKIKHLVPGYFMGQRVVGLNDHFRFSKYYPGGRFEIHKDGINIDKKGNRAVMTLNIFLNVPEEGGGTIFYEDPKTPSRVMLNARPKEGRGALFYNQILHEGETVKKGIKYLIRTDVMVAEPEVVHRPKKPICYVESYNDMGHLMYRENWSGAFNNEQQQYHSTILNLWSNESKKYIRPGSFKTKYGTGRCYNLIDENKKISTYDLGQIKVIICWDERLMYKNGQRIRWYTQENMKYIG